MLLNTCIVLGLVALTAAAPQLQRDIDARDPTLAVERGLVWTPRSLESRKNNNKNHNKNNDKNDIQITELKETKLTIVEQRNEEQLVELVKTKLVVIDQTKRNKDNIRKNHFRNKNKNSNTVIIVVTEVVDSRDSSKVNTRYMTHQIQSNKQIAEKQIVIVSESHTMTIGGKSGTPVRAETSTATGFTPPSIVTYDPKEAAVASNTTNSSILPSGVSAPHFDNAQVNQDPAIILEENQAAFVDFVGPS